MDVIRIGVVGDYRQGNETHRATGTAVDYAARDRGWDAEVTWVASPTVEGAAEPG